jgi:hypothetical protein
VLSSQTSPCLKPPVLTLATPKSSQQLPPQSYLKVLRRTHHREKYTLLLQKSDIGDYEYDTSHMGSWDDIDDSNQGSWAVLVGLLQPFKTCDKSVHISTMLGDSNHVTILRNTVACEDFKDFVALRALHIPYGCLFSTTSQQKSHIAPPPSELLPAGLILLYIEYPRITFFDWLARLSQSREALPKLSRVQIACSDEVGDSYELFKFIEHDHREWTALRSIGVQLEIFYHYS